MNGSGIYTITSKVNGRRYVGSAANIRTRWAGHRCLLRRGKHHSPALQNAWDKHGENAFEWEVVELCDLGLLIEREQHWIDHHRACDRKTGFNVASVAGSRRGVKGSPSATAKRLASLAARSPEEKAATAERLAAARRGYKHRPDTLAKMRGQRRTELTKRRIGEAHRGRPRSLEHRAKIAATLSGRKRGPQSPETIAKRVAATRATKQARSLSR